MARYDYGLRGYRETTAPRRDVGPRGIGYTYDLDYRARTRGLPNRVTAGYNRDYTYDRPYRGYRRNYASFGGDREVRIGDSRADVQPYRTIGGTNTLRGASRPVHEDPRDPLQDSRAGYGYDRDFGRWWMY